MKKEGAEAEQPAAETATASRTSNEHVGEVFNARYRIVRVIGEGGLGRVYEVEHVHVGRRFALKVLKEEHRASASAVARFRQEARVGGLLDTPWTAAVVDYDVFRGIPYLVMEYLEGESLQAVLAREGALPVERTARLILDACRGVGAAHDLGIFHRDLKPGNLFVCRGPDRERVKVLDFGVAKLQSGEDLTSAPPTTSTGGIVGTLAYMPPEQIRGEEPDRTSDVYSLGAILYECLAGFRAFDANTPHALMYQILEERPKPLSAARPEWPVAVTQAVESALSPERAQRPQSALELEHVLAPLVTDAGASVGLSASSKGRREPPPSIVRRPSWALLIGSTAAAAALGGLVAGARESRLPPAPAGGSARAAPSSVVERPLERAEPEDRAGTAELDDRPLPEAIPAPAAPSAPTAAASSRSGAAPARTFAVQQGRATPNQTRPGKATPAAPPSASSVPARGVPDSTARADLDFEVNPYRKGQ